MEDSISRALRLIVEDDRRRPDDEAAVERHWRQEFASVVGEKLLDAVRTWLRENPRGRPNVGKIHELLQRLKPPEEKRKVAGDADRLAELRWAVSILQDPGRYREYQATLSYAEKCLRAQGFQTWQAARSFLEPGWAPNQPREAYL